MSPRIPAILTCDGKGMFVVEVPHTHYPLLAELVPFKVRGAEVIKYEGGVLMTFAEWFGIRVRMATDIEPASPTAI